MYECLPLRGMGPVRRIPIGGCAVPTPPGYGACSQNRSDPSGEKSEVREQKSELREEKTDEELTSDL